MEGLYIGVLEIIERLQIELWQKEQLGHTSSGFSKSPFVHADRLREELKKLFDF